MRRCAIPSSSAGDLGGGAAASDSDGAGGGEDRAQYESMRFSLLCGDMVVEYSIKGSKLEPEAVLDMIQSAAFYRS